MPKDTPQGSDSVYEQARRDFDNSLTATESQRYQSLEDRRFYAISGAQWEGLFGETFKNKPKLEMNKVNLAVYRVVNEWRSNRITVDFTSKDGSEDDGLADLCDGLFRADEQDSKAVEAYDIAFEEMASGGYGAWRLCAEYEDEYDEEDDHQRIRIEPVPDADTTVYWDANATLYDKSDAKFCFVLTGYSRQAYEDEFNDSPQDWGRPVSDTQFDWWDGDDRIYVAEYFKVIEEPYKVYRYRTIDGSMESYSEDDMTEEMEATLNSIGTIRVGEKNVKRKRVKKYVLSGGGILEDGVFIAGCHIPIIPCYGKRSFVDGRERWAGVVRYAKDAQRLYNMQVSYLADIAARGGYEKPIVHPEQINGYEEWWQKDAEENYAYLPLNPITDAQGNEIPGGPVGYTKPPSVPPTMGALIQTVNADMFDILGNQEAGEEVDTQLSGKAIELIQTRLDQQAFIYMSNFAKSVQWSGKVWLSMASELYSEENRRMKVVGRQGKTEAVVMNGRAIFEEDGEIVTENDISRARMDVTADVGPSSSSKRQAEIRNLVSMLQFITDPADQKVIVAEIMSKMEGEGNEDVRNYFRRQLLQMGVVEPTEKERTEMMAAMQQASEPTPDQIYLLSEAQKNEADARKSEAQTIESLAKAEKAKAEAAETLADIENSQRDSVVNAVNSLSNAGATPPLQGVS
mgnify:CR=1 FL=1